MGSGRWSPATFSDRVAARTTAAECTSTEESPTAIARGAGSSSDWTGFTPSGTGFLLPGRTIARTFQPASRNATERCHPRNPVAPVMLTERLFIQPVDLVPAATGRLDAGVDSVVILEGP